MAKLTRKQLMHLSSIARNLQRGHGFLAGENVAVMRKGGPATTTMHAVRPMDGAVFYEINKQAGSELVFIDTALAELGRFIAQHTKGAEHG